MQVTINARLELKHSTYTWTGNIDVDNAEEAITLAQQHIEMVQISDSWRRISIDVYNGDIE